MGDSGMGEFAQIASIFLQGAKFGFDVSKDALKVAMKFLTWIFNKAEAGIKNKSGLNFRKNILERSRGDVQYFKVKKDSKETKDFYKLLKKNKIPYSKMPTFRCSEDKEHEYIMYCTCDATRFNHCAEQLVEVYKDNPSEVGSVSFDEMADGTGLSSVSEEEFNKEMKKIFGDNYKDFKQIGELKKNEDSLEVSEHLDEIGASARFKDEMTKDNTISFKYEFEPEKVLGQTDTHLMLKLGDKDSDMGVWLPKNQIYPKVDENYRGDILVCLPKDSNVIIESINPSDKYYLNTYANELSKRINDVYYNKNLETISIDKSLVKHDNNGLLTVRVPGYYGQESEACITLKEDSYKYINNGKTIVTRLDPNREYELMYIHSKKKEKVLGESLLSPKHFKPVSEKIDGVAKEMLKATDVMKNALPAQMPFR